MSATMIAPAETSTTPTWVKVSREDMDKMVRFGSDEFIRNTMPLMTKAELDEAMAYAREKDAVKKVPSNFLVFPVSTPKQINAGKLYLGSLKRFMAGAQRELDRRLVAETFGSAA